MKKKLGWQQQQKRKIDIEIDRKKQISEEEQEKKMSPPLLAVFCIYYSYLSYMI